MGLKDKIISIVWGFAEATLFFVIPDVWLSFAAKDKLKTGFLACFYSLAGALVGGFVMYLWGQSNPEIALKIVELVPAVSIEMVDRVHTELSENGLMAILLGPAKGTPYKIYAVHAAGVNISLVSFMLITIPARLIRFVLVTILSHYIVKGIRKWKGEKVIIPFLISTWVLIYVIYLSLMPW